MQEFITIKTAEGTYLPMAFIARNNEAGNYAKNAKSAQKLLEDGDSFVVVSFVEVTN